MNRRQLLFAMAASATVGPGCAGPVAEDVATIDQSYVAVSCPNPGDPGFRSVPYLADEYIEGYTDQTSYGPADDIHVFVSAKRSGQTLADITATYYHLTQTHALATGNSVVAVRTSSLGIPQPIPLDASHCGARWSEDLSLGLPAALRAGLESGLYAIKLEFTNYDTSGMGTAERFKRRFWIPLVVRANDPNAQPVVVMAASNTWQAYNSWPLSDYGATAANVSGGLVNGDPLAGHSYYEPAVPPGYGGCVGGQYSPSGPLFQYYPTGDGPTMPLCGGEAGKIVHFQRPNGAVDPAIDISYRQLFCGPTESCNDCPPQGP